MPPSAPKEPNLISVTTINRDGSHHVLHPADVRGRFTATRRIFGAVLLLVYAGLPWIEINGSPAVFLDVAHRRFHLFGLTLVPQDLWVLFFAITGLGFVLFFLTSLLGRLWCGWACPYTLFLEHLFRRVERLIDGDAPARRRLQAAPWTRSKILRRVLKHALYLLLASLIAHIFLSYFISLKGLYEAIHEGPLKHLPAFLAITVSTGVLYLCFSWFREQFCVILCPYGRLQSALTDEDTVVIGYDVERGEPRGAKGRTEGDCIDCRRCVQVCPTGIDIRNGLQLECIGCAACIDACNEIMTKVDRPPGLVRYDSMNGLAAQPRRILRPRIFAYALLGLLGLTALAFTAREKARPFNVTSSRMAGRPFEVTADHVINRYQLRLINKRKQEATFRIELLDPPAGFSISGSERSVSVPAQKEITRPAILMSTKEGYQGPEELTLLVRAQPGDVELTHKLRFVGPNPGSVKNGPQK